jgi:predicted membrane channel-forming protein YqfA (hemolysin III family)
MTPTIGLLLAAYFIPTLIAAMRGHPQVIAIAVLSIALGWTLLGWIVALVWSVTAKSRPVVIVNGVVQNGAVVPKKKPTIRRDGDYYVIEE